MDEEFIIIHNGECFTNMIGQVVRLSSNMAKTIVREKIKGMEPGDTIHIQRMI